MIKRISYLVLGLVCCVTFAFGQQPPTFTISPQTITVDPDENFSVDVTLSNYTDFISFQFNINWDPTLLQYESVSNLNSTDFPGFGASGIGDTEANTAQGRFGVNWFDNNLTPVTVPDGTVLFTINFTALTSGNSEVLIAPEFEIITADEDVVTIIPENAIVTVTGDVTPGNTDPLGVSANNASGQNGTNICVPIRVSNFDDVNGVQFSINYDPAVLNYSSLQNFGVTGLDANDFMVPPSSAEGQIAIDWSNPTGVSIADNGTLVEVCFDIVGTAPASSAISFTGTPTAINVTTVASNGEDVGITSSTGTITVSSSGGGGGDGTLEVSAGNTSGDTGTEVCIPVTVSNFNEIVSFQYSINYDPDVLSFSSVRNFGLIGLSASAFGAANPGQITVSWFDDTTEGVTLPDNTILYELCFDLIDAGNSSISFTGTPSPIEVTTVESNGTDIGLTPTSGTITATGDGGGGGGGNNGELVVTAGSTTGMTGTEVCIPVTASNFNEIVSFQYSINYNPSVLTFNGAQNFNLVGLTEGAFGNATPGNITVSWLDETTNGVTLADNTVLYELCFTLTNGGNSSISFSGNPLSIEVTTVESNGVDIGLDANSGQIVSEGDVVFDGLTFVAATESVEPGDDFCIDVTVHDFTDLISFQYSMTWDPNVIQFTGLEGFGLPDMTEAASFGTSGVEDGELTVSWLDDTTEGVTVANGTSIFQVCFTAVGTLGQSSGITFGSSPTSIEVIDNQENEVNPDFSNGTVTIEDGAAVPTIDFIVTPPSEAVAIGNNFCMPLSVMDFTNITDMQFTINYPSDLLQFTEAQITGNLAGLGDGQINSSTAGQITINWTAPNGSETLADGTAILNLCFTVLQAGANNSATITFTNGSVNNADGDVVPFNGPQVNIPLGNPPVVFPVAAANVCAEPGEQVCVPVRTFNFDALVSIQHTIDFDESMLEFESVNILAAGTNPMGLSQSSFNTLDPNTSQGFIPFSWLENNLDCITLADDTPIYEICFTVIGNAGQTTPIAFTDNPLTFEVTNCDEDIVPWLGQGGQVEIKASCTDVCIINVEETVTDVTCNGETDGSISLMETGCTGTPTYAWSSGQGNTSTITDLPAGNYTVTVTADGAQAIETYQVNEPSAVSISNVTPTDATCNGNTNGSIELTVEGGAENYNYSFSPGGATSNPATGLSPGTYAVTVTDGNGCTTTTDNIVVGEPAEALSINSSVTDVVCGGDATGAIDLNVTGGTPDYTVNWSNAGVTGANPMNLSAGDYLVTVTDNNGCIQTENVTIATLNPAIVISNMMITPISGGDNNGAVNVDVSGGTEDYMYAWTGPNFTASTKDISGLSEAGEYVLTVTDASTSCTATVTATVGSALSVNEGEAAIVNTCFGQNTGGIDITPMGGTPPYTYAWSNDSSPDEDLTGVGAGSYTVTITDAANATATATFEVTATPEIIVSGAISPDNGGGNGAIDLTAEGGIGTFSYSWSPGGETTEDLDSQMAGTYTVTITDGTSNCTAVQSFEIPLQEEALGLALIEPEGVSCNGMSDGEVTIMVQGGSPDYEISFEPAVADQPFFSNGAGQQIYTGFSGGSYTINITDGIGSVYSETFIVPEPDAIVLDDATHIFDAINTVNCDGGINLEVTGGIEPYSYMWTASNGETVPNVEDPGQLCPAVYDVIVTDANNCAQTISGLVIKEFTVQDQETVVNNPSCPGSLTGSIDAAVINGAAPLTYTWTNEAGEEVATTEDLTNVPEGTYTFEVRDADGRTITQQYTLTASSNLSATAVVESDYNGFGVRCAASEDARLRATPVNGTSPYTYEWDNGLGTTDVVLDAPAGLQTVTVTDNAGCETEASVMVIAPAAIIIDLDFEDISCHDENDGEIIAFASGGTGGFNYRWDDGPNGSSRFNLEEGTYNLEVTDNNGCRVDSTKTITNPDVLTIEAIANPITDGETGSADVIVAGGTAPYSYTWNDANNTETKNLDGITKEGDYVVIVSDANGCVKVADVEVSLLANCLKSRPVITPNEDGGDGLNDAFIINCVENYPGNTLEIYNRWGQLVFEADDYDNSWMGTNRRGNPLPEGGYFYVLIYKDAGGQLTQLKGSLSILRQ